MLVVCSSIPLVNMNLVFLLETRVKTKQHLRLLLREGGQAQRQQTWFSVCFQKFHATAAHHAQMEGEMMNTLIIHWWFFCYCLLSGEIIYTQEIREIRISKASCCTLMKSGLRAYITALPWRKAVAASEYLPLLDRQKGIQSYVIFNSLWLPKHYENFVNFEYQLRYLHYRKL